MPRSASPARADPDSRGRDTDERSRRCASYLPYRHRDVVDHTRADEQHSPQKDGCFPLLVSLTCTLQMRRTQPTQCLTNTSSRCNAVLPRRALMRRNAEVTTDSRRDIRRGGDRIVFDGHQKDSEAGGKSLDDRIQDDRAERRQRDSARRRRDDSPDRRNRRPEGRLDDERCDRATDWTDRVPFCAPRLSIV